MTCTCAISLPPMSDGSPNFRSCAQSHVTYGECFQCPKRLKVPNAYEWISTRAPFIGISGPLELYIKVIGEHGVGISGPLELYIKVIGEHGVGISGPLELYIKVIGEHGTPRWLIGETRRIAWDDRVQRKRVMSASGLAGPSTWLPDGAGLLEASTFSIFQGLLENKTPPTNHQPVAGSSGSLLMMSIAFISILHPCRETVGSAYA
jgi:hypothetical protein